MKYFLLPLICLMLACSQDGTHSEEITAEQLAVSACASCHAYPDPALLPKEQWKSVLPRMGLRLGIESPEIDPFPGFKLEETQRVLGAQVFPNEQLIEDSLWVKLQQYFLSNAPDSFQLDQQEHPLSVGLFKTAFPALNIGGAPFISMVKFIGDELYLSDIQGNMMLLDSSFRVKSFAGFPRPIIDVSSTADDKLYVLSIGDLYPNDRLVGGFASLTRDGLHTQELLFEKLARPVHFSMGDIDGDGLEDVVICNFGNYVGDLSWYRNTGNGYEARVIKPVPGASKTYLQDLDGDGDLDIAALFAQGDESVSLFFNENGSFKEKQVLRFSPVYGSNDMVLADMDGDGDLDMVISNGDNGDYSITLKPYHGIRIYLNDGALNFEEHSFYPLYGSSKVRVEDFDLDGDLDMIAASFFPESKTGIDQSILLLMNQGELTFESFSVEGASDGRWMVMDTGDVDSDGDIDVILGSFVLAHEGIDASLIAKWRSEQKHILALINKTID